MRRKRKRKRNSVSSLNLLSQICIHSRLLLSPETNTADGREEEHDTITKLARSHQKKRSKGDIPHSNTQAPDTLRLHTNPLRHANPALVIHRTTQVLQVRTKMRRKGISRAPVVVSRKLSLEDIADLAALKVREGFPDYDCNNNHGYEQERV